MNETYFILPSEQIKVRSNNKWTCDSKWENSLLSCVEERVLVMLKENVYVMNWRNKNMLNGKWEFKNITRQPIIFHMEYAEWLLVINKLNHKKHFFKSRLMKNTTYQIPESFIKVSKK